jgi:hypothetical protein
MNWNEPYLFPSFGWSGRVNPWDRSLALHLFADPSFEGGNDFSQCLTLASRGTYESRQVSDPSPNSTAGVRGYVDNAIEDGNFSSLRVGAGVRVDVLPLCYSR